MRKGRLVQQTPEEAAAVEAYNAMTPAEKAAQTRAQRRPGDVREMIVPDEASSTVYASKAEFDKANLFDTLSGKTPVGSYREGNKIITITKQSLGPFGERTITRAVDAKTGEPVPVGAKWDANAGDPEPFSSKVRAKLKKD
jgi:hypothetical protein